LRTNRETTPEGFHDEVLSDHITRNREASQQVNDPQSLPAHEVARVRTDNHGTRATSGDDRTATASYLHMHLTAPLRHGRFSLSAIRQRAHPKRTFCRHYQCCARPAPPCPIRQGGSIRAHGRPGSASLSVIRPAPGSRAPTRLFASRVALMLAESNRVCMNSTCVAGATVARVYEKCHIDRAESTRPPGCLLS